MQNLTAEDIEKLDFLLHQIVDWDAHVSSEDLIKAEYYKPSDHALAEANFDLYLRVFRDFEIGNESRAGSHPTLSVDSRATRFKEEGGFRKHYDKLVKLESDREARETLVAKRNAMEMEKSRVLTEMAETMMKDYRNTKSVAWTALVLVLLLVIYEVLQYLGILETLDLGF
jgi:hypothetical protein